MLILSKNSLDKHINAEVKKVVDNKIFEQVGKGSMARGQMPSTLGEGLVYNEDNVTLATYKKMEKDGGIVAPLTIIKAPIKSVEWNIESESKEVAEFVKEALEIVWQQLVDEMLLALNFGYQSFEKVFERTSKGIVYKKFLSFDPENITVKIDDMGGFAGIQLEDPLNKIQLPPEKCFHYVNEMRWSNFYGHSAQNPAYPYWFLDKYAYEFESVFLEKLASGVVIGYAPSGKTTVDGVEYDNIDTMNTIAKDIRGGGTATLPSEMWANTDKARKWAIEILESKKDNKQFISTHEHLDTMKARAVFVPDLVYTAGKVGSYALGKEHSNNFILSIKARLDNIKIYLDRYVIPQLVWYNFGSTAPRAEWVYSTLSTETIVFLKELFIEMTKKGKAPNLDWEFVFNALGIPVPSALKKAGGQPTPGEIDNTEEEEIVDNSGHKCGSGIQLETKNKVNYWGKRIDLESLEKNWDGIDDKILGIMEAYIGQSKDNILKQYEAQMERGKITANEIKIVGVTAYKAKLKSLMTDALRIGIDSAKDELSSDQNFAISLQTRNWVDTKVNNIVNKQLEDLRFQLGMGIEDTLQANLAPGGYDKSTINEAVVKATENYNTWISFNLTINSRSLTSNGINEGRSIVADNVK